MAYWGGIKHPPYCLRFRVVKDDYDFSSALFYSVQTSSAVLGRISFRSDGGDRHISLDPIRGGGITLSSLSIQAEFDVWDHRWRLYTGSREVKLNETPLPLDDPLYVDAGEMQFAFQFLQPSFGSYKPSLYFSRTQSGKAVIKLVLLQSTKPVTVHWDELKSGGCGLAMLAMEGTLQDILSAAVFRQGNPRATSSDGQVQLEWHSPAGHLELTAAGSISTAADMDRVFLSRIDGRPVPIQRLSDERLVR